MSYQSERQPLLQTKMPSSNPLKIAVIIITGISFLVVAAINALAATPIGSGIFENNTGEISNALYLEVTPAGWTFTIWGFIYTWQAAWIIYAFTTICRREAGTQLYLLPVYPTALFIAYILSNAFNVGWLFAWDRFRVAIAFPLLVLTALSLYVCLFFSLKRIYENLNYIKKQGLTLDLWLNRMLIQNGIAFYGAWVTVAAVLNFALVLTYKDGSDITDIGVPQDVSSTVFLAVVAVIIVVWFSLDIFAFDKYTRYLFSPYITLTVAFSGIVQKNFYLDTAYRNSVFSVILLVVAAVCLVTKVTVMIVRHIRKPIVSASMEIPPTF